VALGNNVNVARENERFNKMLFIVPADAHYCKIIGKLKPLKL
jgi:hypothetical protein